MESRVAIIGIIVEDPASIEELNQILHAYGEFIIGRFGIPYGVFGIIFFMIGVVWGVVLLFERE